MSGKKIKSLLKEAAVYRRQSLLEEAKKKYIEALTLIENGQHFQKDKHKQLIESIHERIEIIEKDIQEFKQLNETVELTPEVKNLILDLFSFSKNTDASAVEGAAALAQFGQHEEALTRFRKLIEEGSQPLLAAKNILKGHLDLSSPEGAIAEFRQWARRGTFPKRYLKNLREFLVKLLERQGIKADLPEVVATIAERGRVQDKGEEVPDISLVTIQLENGPRIGDLVEFDVSFQTGNTVCFCIPAARKDLLNAFKPGTQLQNMQCYSVLAVFSGSGVVSGQTRIGSGPNQGDYALDITLNAEPQLIIGGPPEPAIAKDPDSEDQASILREKDVDDA